MRNFSFKRFKLDDNFDLFFNEFLSNFGTKIANLEEEIKYVSTFLIEDFKVNLKVGDIYNDKIIVIFFLNIKNRKLKKFLIHFKSIILKI